MKFPDEHPALLYESTRGGGAERVVNCERQAWRGSNDTNDARRRGEAAQESFRAHFPACGQSQKSFAGLIPEILCGLN